MKSTKVLFLYLVFSLMSFLLSNVVQYLTSSKPARTSGKLFLVFGIFAKPVIDLITINPLDRLFLFLVYFIMVLVGGFLVLIVNVVVQAMVRRWRLLKTLISFYIPISLIPSPIFMSWLIIGYVNVISVFYSFMVFVYTSLAMIYVRSTLRRRTKINANETDEQNYIRIFQEQLEREESLKVNIIQYMTVGPPSVGETTLKKHLLANHTLETSDYQPPSSPVCEEVKIAQITLEEIKTKQLPCTVAVDKYNWKTCTIDEQMIGCLKTMSQNKSRYVSTNEVLFWTNFLIMMALPLVVCLSYIRREKRLDDEDHNYNDQISTLRQDAFDDGTMYGVACLFFFLLCVITLTINWIYSCCVKRTETNIKTADDLVRETLHQNIINRITSFFDRTFTIYFRDCGGQPEFHEVVPALVPHSIMFFLVFNLSNGLDTQYKVLYKTSDGKVSDPYVSSFTVKEVLLQCLASISSIGKYSKPQTNIVKFSFMRWWKRIVKVFGEKVKMTISKVIVIGTHKDKLGDAREADDKVFHINNQFENELNHTDWYFNDMIVRTENGNPILGVNTFNPSDIIQVKDLVNEVALNGDYQFEIPLSWLVFDFCMQKFEKKVISLKECQNLSQECSISLGDEFNAALWFLHNKVGTIRYFKNVPKLQNVVITDPQLLFDLVTDLIVNTFSFKRRIHRKSEHDRFRLSGRFTKHHLEHCEAVKENLLSVEQVIAVLEHLVIIAPVGINESNEQEYFLPCVLVHASLPSTPLLHNDSDIPPLLITFKCQYTPRGIFSSVIAKILLDGKDKWKLSSEEIFRDQVEFYLVKTGHNVTLTNFFRFLEIVVKSPCGFNRRSDKNVYISVQQYISHCLTYVKNQLNYTDTADYHFGFYCKEHKSSSIEDHPAICNNDCPTYTTCSRNGSLKSYLLPQQQLWFNGKISANEADYSYTVVSANEIDLLLLDAILATTPEKHTLLTLLASVSAKWQEIGDLLGVDSNTIEGLYTSNLSNQVKMSKMFQSWLDNAPTPTWYNIINVLEGPLKKKSLAAEIRNTLANHDKNC